MSLALTQADAEALLAMEKVRVSEERLRLPDHGGKLTAPLVSSDGAENFYLDVWRGHAKLTKGKIQNRARNVVVLARIDFGGAPHRNPDDEQIPCPHLHVYREGYGTRWAIKAPTDIFHAPDDHWQTLLDFMRYCNVRQPPLFDRGLFT
jgi:hypothetical protein